jgi:hypothetical protein
VTEQWDPAEIAEHGKSVLDIFPFALGYTDLAVHLAEKSLRATFAERGIYVDRGHRNLTNRFDPAGQQFLREVAEEFFVLNEPVLGWWQPMYAGAQLWAHSNGVADDPRLTRLPERIGGDRGVFSTLAALHRHEPRAQEAYAQARNTFIVAASSTRGFELYVNDAGRIDVKR